MKNIANKREFVLNVERKSCSKGGIRGDMGDQKENQKGIQFVRMDVNNKNKAMKEGKNE